jgi:hypothetical protein
MTTLIRRARLGAAICAMAVTPALLSVPLTAQAQQQQQVQQAQPAPKHHSMVKGALVGAAAGHMLGGHAKAGAAAGVLWQHHKNKKEKKAAMSGH